MKIHLSELVLLLNPRLLNLSQHLQSADPLLLIRLKNQPLQNQNLLLLLNVNLLLLLNNELQLNLKLLLNHQHLLKGGVDLQSRNLKLLNLPKRPLDHHQGKINETYHLRNPNQNQKLFQERKLPLLLLSHNPRSVSRFSG